MGDNSDIREQMQEYFDTLKQTRPDPKDPTFLNPDGTPANDLYQAALSEWGQEYRATAELLTNLEQQDLGIMTMPDGTLVPLDSTTPAQRDAYNKYNLQIYNQLLDAHGLSEFSLRRQSAIDENSRRMDEYTTKVDELRNKQSVDAANLDRALAGVERWMNGQSVAGNDADRIAAAQAEASKYGTRNGKRSFSGRDLGGAVSMLAQQGGIGLDAPLLSYPGTQILDPVGDRLNSLAAMGIDNAPPDLPMPSVSMADVPAPPALSPLPTGGGVGSAPTAPNMLPVNILPDWTPTPDVGSWLDKVTSNPAPAYSPPGLSDARQIVAR